MNHNPIVSQEEWVAARKQLLDEEKELTAAFDALNNKRRELPWVKVEKEYLFDTPQGKKTLADLFEGRSQLIVYHFMLGPGWKAGCVGCSFFADHVDGANVHLAHHDVSFVAVSRAPLPEVEAYQKRMGWRFKWISSNGNDFNFDYHVSFRKDEMAEGKVYYNYQMTKATTEELPGMSVFFKDDSGAVFHTYSAYARGDERGLGTYMFLDLTPKGRDENGPNYNLMDWVHRHDEYGNGKSGEERH
ncbi:MAG TPA: thioredoxin family protein [Candidatus Binataceae bacterium]|nr:thioredoxin family protein [Candidatus Binataceae bacterium]